MSFIDLNVHNSVSAIDVRSDSNLRDQEYDN